MSRSPLRVGFAEVDEAIWSPTLCLLHFLPLLRSQALWPGFVAALGELQTGCRVLWTPQRAAYSGRSVLHSLGKYILPFAPSACAPNASHSLVRKCPSKVCLWPPPLSQPLDSNLLPSQSPGQCLSSKPSLFPFQPPSSHLELHHPPFGSCFPRKPSRNMDEHFSKNDCIYQLSGCFSERLFWHMLISATKQREVHLSYELGNTAY